MITTISAFISHILTVFLNPAFMPYIVTIVPSVVRPTVSVRFAHIPRQLLSCLLESESACRGDHIENSDTWTRYIRV